MNKVWIVPAKAEVLESNGIVLVGEKRLKVMMDEERSNQKDRLESLTTASAVDYDVMTKATKGQSSVSSQIFRDMILPNIEKEINEGKIFVNVRQIYNSVILAAWYKKALKESLLGRVYADKGKVAGVETDDKEMKQRIYEQYLATFEKGVYNVIKEEQDIAGDLIPRKYFSGGIAGFGAVGSSALTERAITLDQLAIQIAASSAFVAQVYVATESNDLVALKGKVEELTVVNQTEEVSKDTGNDFYRRKILQEIGLNMIYVSGELSKYDALIKQYVDLPVGVTRAGLSEEDVRFLVSYGELFSSEYYTEGTISGYISKVVTRYQVEKFGLEWDKLSSFLIEKRLASRRSQDEIFLLVDPQKMDLSNFGIDAEKIRKILRESYDFPFEVDDLERQRVKDIIVGLKLAKDIKVLDYGSGMGLYVGAMREFGYNAFGAEVSFFAREHAPEQTRDYIKLIKVKDDFDYLRGQNYDFVIVKDVLEHVPIKVLPRLLISLANVAPEAFIMLPFTNSAGGAFVNEGDEKDMTHVVRKSKSWWIKLMGTHYKEMEWVNQALKGEKSKGTLSLAVRFDESFKSAIMAHDWLKEISTLSSSSVADPEETKAAFTEVTEIGPLGGIDFDPTNMNLQIKRDGKGVPLPLPQQNLDQINIQGLFPVIINIVPVNPQILPIFLGQAPKEPTRESELVTNTAG